MSPSGYIGGMNVNRAVLFIGGLSIGIIAGLRSMTPPALVAWAVHLGWLDVTGSRFAFLGSTATVAILSLLALGELVADKLPFIPNRTSLGPLLARLATGAFSAAVIFASARQPLFAGIVLGAVGAGIGTFAGYNLRHKLVNERGIPDYAVALAEDIVAVGGGLLLVSHMF